jgi:hypothetical protein
MRGCLALPSDPRTRLEVRAPARRREPGDRGDDVVSFALAPPETSPRSGFNAPSPLDAARSECGLRRRLTGSNPCGLLVTRCLGHCVPIQYRYVRPGSCANVSRWRKFRSTSGLNHSPPGRGDRPRTRGGSSPLRIAGSTAPRKAGRPDYELRPRAPSRALRVEGVQYRVLGFVDRGGCEVDRVHGIGLSPARPDAARRSRNPSL